MNIVRVTAVRVTGRRLAFFANFFPAMYQKKNAKNAKRRGRAGGASSGERRGSPLPFLGYFSGNEPETYPKKMEAARACSG